MGMMHIHEDAQIINNDQEWLKSNQTYTFYNTQFLSSPLYGTCKRDTYMPKKIKNISSI